MQIGLIIADLIQIYNGLLIFWCLLSWFPTIRWYDQPWKTLDQVIQPVMGPFRKVIPPINGMDLSPMIATVVLLAIARFAASLPF